MERSILSFDGGGVRGAISLAFLTALERDTGIPVSQKADLIAGTSTGAIIAGALSVGMSPEEILGFYASMSGAIFQKKESFDEFLRLKPKYSSSSLYQALEKVFSAKGVDPKIPLNKLSKQIVIPTVSLDNQSLKRWCTQILTNADTIPLIDALMESTAAPTYFPSFNDHVDGGMAANDPAAIAYAISDGAKALLSFGTGYTPYHISKGEDWGALSWIVDLDPEKGEDKTPLLTMLFDVQDQLPGQLCQLFMGERYRRQNLELSKAVALDDASQVPFLIQETKHYIDSHPSVWKALCEWTTKYFT